MSTDSYVFPASYSATGTFKRSQARTGGHVQLCAVLCGSLVIAFVFIFAWICSPQQASLQIGHQFSDRQNIFLMHTTGCGDLHAQEGICIFIQF